VPHASPSSAANDANGVLHRPQGLLREEIEAGGVTLWSCRRAVAAAACCWASASACPTRGISLAGYGSVDSELCYAVLLLHVQER
jgi:hypothetical protein